VPGAGTASARLLTSGAAATSAAATSTDRACA
jgi:hypothetical protein